MVPMYSYLLVYALHLPASLIGMYLLVHDGMLKRKGGKVIFTLVIFFFLLFAICEYLSCYQVPFWWPARDSIL